MSCTLHPENACVKSQRTWLSRGNKYSLSPAAFQNGLVEIGKLNIFLIGLIIVIMIALISQEDGSTLFSNQTVRLQTVTTPEIAALDTLETSASHKSESNEEEVSNTEAADSPKAELKPLSKKTRKNEKISPLIESPDNQTESVTVSRTSQTEPAVEHQDRLETEHPAPKETSRNIIIFNIWSVSELRLRSAFTKLINDGSAPVAIAESRKKEYLNFVNKRSHKCGELNNKFASNINTVEKLTFKDKDLDILECHTSENNTELTRVE